MAGNRTRRELGKYWKFISQDSMDAKAYEDAKRWLAEHPDEVKELDNLIASSDRKARRHRADQTVEQTEYRRTYEYNPEAILPPEVRHALYGDRRWFDRAAYMPADAGDAEEPYLYLDTRIVEGLEELNERQREVLFRTVINGEPTASVAEDFGCTDRNIRDIRSRAIGYLQRKVGQKPGEGSLVSVVVIAAFLLALGLLYYFLEKYHVTIPSRPAIRLPMGAFAAVAVVVIGLYLMLSRRSIRRRLRRHWASLNGGRKR